MKKIFNVMLTVVACTVIIGFSGCKITATPVPEANYKITYVSAENQSLLPSSKTVKEGYKLTAEDLPNLEVGLDTETADDDEYCIWDKEIGDVVSGDITITANWEQIYYLKNFADIISYMEMEKTQVEKIVFTSETYTDISHDNGCAVGAPSGYFKGVISPGSDTNKKTVTIYGNGHRIYAPNDCKQFFNGLSAVKSIEFDNFYTSKTTNMMGMFTGCTVIESLDLSSFDTSSVTDMSSMFSACSALKTLDVSKFNTSAVKNMDSMFKECYLLEKLDLSSFDTSAVTAMGSMFQCKVDNPSKLTSIIFSSKFKTDIVKDMSHMFENCSSLTTLDLSSFTRGQGLSNITNLFTGCINLTTIYATSGFDLSSMDNTEIFKDDAKLVGGNGTTCNGSNNIGTTYARIDTASNPGYFTLKQ